MKKKSIWIISMMTIIVLLVIGLVVAQNRQEKTSDQSQGSNKTTNKATNHIQIFPPDLDINEIDLQLNKEDEIIITKKESGQWEVDQSNEETSQFKIDQLIALLQEMEGEHDDSISLEEAKLLDGDSSIEFIDKSGESKSLKIGKRSDDESFYYVMFKDNQKVYQVNAQWIDSLPKNVSDLYDRSIVQVRAQDLNKIIIHNSIQTIELVPSSPYSEEEVRTNLSGWFMHQPYTHVYSVKFNQMEDMIYGINHLEWSEIINEDENNLEEYGLNDSNFVITLQSEESKDTIIIGAPATGQTHYAMLEGDNRVFTIENDALHPYSYQAFDMVEKFVKIIPIDVLKELHIHTEEGVDTSITVEHHEGSDVDDEFQINDKAIEEQAFRDLYKVIAGLSVSEAVNDATYGDSDATMSYMITDKETKEKEIKIEFVHYDKENYAVFIDEKADFIMKKEDFSHMIDQIDNLGSTE